MRSVLKAKALAPRLALVGALGLGALVGPAANAHADVGTWELEMTVLHTNSLTKFVRIDLEGASGFVDICVPIEAGQTRTLNVAGVLGATVEIVSYSAPGCDGAYETPNGDIVFNEPHTPGTTIWVVFGMDHPVIK
jgi:hypothetical protein